MLFLGIKKNQFQKFKKMIRKNQVILVRVIMMLKILIKQLNQVNLLIKLLGSVHLRFKAEIIIKNLILIFIKKTTIYKIILIYKMILADQTHQQL